MLLCIVFFYYRIYISAHHRTLFQYIYIYLFRNNCHYGAVRYFIKYYRNRDWFLYKVCSCYYCIRSNAFFAFCNVVFNLLSNEWALFILMIIACMLGVVVSFLLMNKVSKFENRLDNYVNDTLGGVSPFLYLLNVIKRIILIILGVFLIIKKMNSGEKMSIFRIICIVIGVIAVLSCLMQYLL